MEQEFRQTEIEKIPKGWALARLEEITLDLIGGGTPSTSRPEYWDGDIPWMTSANLTDRVVIRGMRNITKRGLQNSATNIVLKGSLLISTRVGIGKVGIAGIDIAISQDLTGLVLHFGKVDVEYLYWAFLNQSSHLGLLSQGSTVKGLTRDYLKNLKFSLPPLPEQKKIAEILSTVDQAIEKVDEAIEKTQRLKKGLMQALLTKGIGHKEFKDTEIGRIPKEWILEVAEKVCSKVTDGTHDTPKPSENGYYLVTSKDIKEGGINFSQTYLISEDDFNEINRRSKVDSYDVLFSMIGTVGQTAIVKDNYPKFAIKNVGLFKTNNSKVLARWLHYYFGSKFAQFYIKNSTKGTTQKYLPLFSLRSFPITVAPLQEQQKIAEILNAVDERIELLRRRKERLERIKKGLMSDLLTGRKRVKLN